MKHLLRLFGVALLLLCVTSVAAADNDWQAAVGRDFSLKQAVVVRSVGDEYLIDQDAASGVRIGDLFSSVRRGQQIVHPLSGETLGSLDELQGILQVVRIKSGYAYARNLGVTHQFQPGDMLSRYAQIPAVVKGGSASIVSALQAALPHLEWLSDQSSVTARLQELELAKPPLTFTFFGTRLTVVDNSGAVAGEYALPPSSAVVAETISPVPPTPQLPTPTVVLPSGLIGPEAQGVVERDLVRSPPLAMVPTGVAIGDFDNDGSREFAVGHAGGITVMRLSQGRFATVAEISSPRGVKVLALDAIDIDGDGRAELYATGVHDTHISSYRVVFGSEGYRIDMDGLSWMFRVMKITGRQELYGQKLGTTVAPFAEKIVRLTLDSGVLTAAKEKPPVAGVNLYNDLPVPGSSQKLTAMLTDSDHLRIVNSAGEILWESADEYGGTERKVVRLNASSGVMEYHQTSLQATMTQLGSLLLIPQNEGSRTFSHSVEFKASRVVAMSWDGYTMQEEWSTQKEAGYLADFEVGDIDNDGRDELIMAVIYSRTGLFSTARAVLLVYELPEGQMT